MSEPKPFASLSSGLLARKGAARPAMRPQGFGQVGNGLEDLGWNDMGFEPPKAASAPRDSSHDGFGEEIVEHPRAHHPTGLSPVESPVHGQQAEIADRFGVDDDAAVDEDYDETAEPYDPEAPFVAQDDEDEEDGEEGGAEAYHVAPEPLAEAPPPAEIAPTPPPQPPVVEPDSQFEDRPIATAAPKRRAPAPRSAPGQKGKAAFTLRLDPERHLKLRLACAVNGRSAQMLVTEALDQLLADMPELHDLAAKANRKG